MPKLSDYIHVNDNFKNAINIYLSLNKTDKILSYIPTKSSVGILDQYIEAVNKNIEQATLLIGPYGKGKSHLLLVLLSVLTLERTPENEQIINSLIQKVNNVDETAASHIRTVWNNKRRFLPVIISPSYSDLDQAFLVALNEAIKRANLTELIPDTFYSRAIENIDNWEESYQDTYKKFVEELSNRKLNIQDFVLALKECRKEALAVFREIYPMLTSGSHFNPMINTDILPLFKNISDILYDEYNYDGIYIIFDEFSKFIESKDKTAAGNDMKLLQEICELAQDSKNSQIFITMVAHKSIKEYGNYLSKEIINSFTGIEGRITEKLFVTSSKNNYELIQNAIVKKYEDEKDLPYIINYVNENLAEKVHAEIPFFHSSFEYNIFYNVVVRGCYPLNPVSAYMLLNISEKVAQNERTLFTFISKNEPNSMGRFIQKQTQGDPWIVGADLVYDYFKGIFKKDIQNKFIHDEWLKAEYAISQCTTDAQVKIVKALAVINIINKPEELPADKKVLQYAVKIPAFNETIDEMLELQTIIYFKSSTGRIVFKTNVGTDLGKIIKNKRNLMGTRVNVGKVLSMVSNTDFVIPKKYNQDFAMTRYFRYEFMTYDNFNSLMVGDTLFDPKEFCDGKVIAIINEDGECPLAEISNKLKAFALRHLVILVPNKPFDLLTQMQDFEIIQSLKRDPDFIKENAVLQAELDVFEDDLSLEFNNYLQACYGSESGCVALTYTDSQVVEHKKYDVEQLVSEICESYYSETPVVNNELINKHEIKTSPIKKARKSIIAHILEGMKDDSFSKGSSPEATIFRSLFFRTGILDDVYQNEKMVKVLSIITDFLKSCEQTKGKVADLIEQLRRPPFGIRDGIIPCYLAYCIYQQSGDVVAYLGEKEFDINEEILLNICDTKYEYYLFISTENAEKEWYIAELNSLFMQELDFDLNGSRLNNILVSMQRWYRALPLCTRNFKQLPGFIDEDLHATIMGVRSLLQKADANPYQVIFNEIPSVLHTEVSYKDTIAQIKSVKKALETHLDSWLNEIAIQTIKIFDEKKDDDLHHVLKQWYDKQSELAKRKVSNSRVTGLMGCIVSLNVFDDGEVVRKLARIITGNYIENWSDDTKDAYLDDLKEAKAEIEQTKGDSLDGENTGEISFTNSKGELITRCYERVTENDGTIMRNLIEDALDSFHDTVSTNEQVAILVEMLELILS
ncbi:MAG: hypothetical protein ACRDBO_16525 [Lachnospiraceae bacterium]